MQANGRTLRRLNTLLHPLGLHLTTREVSDLGFVLNRYLRPDGGFDYARYKAVQTAGNRRKIDQVFATEANIDVLAGYLRRKLGHVDKGLCHGTRRGARTGMVRRAPAGLRGLGHRDFRHGRAVPQDPSVGLPRGEAGVAWARWTSSTATRWTTPTTRKRR